MKRYSEYKDSGVKWIGEIPGHWKCAQIGRLFSIKAGGDVKPDLFSDKQDHKHPYPVYTNTKSATDVYAYTSNPTCKANTITVTGRGEVGHAIFRETPYDAIIRLLSLESKSELANPKFHTYVIDTIIPFTSDSAAIGQLSAIQIKPKYIPVPTIKEQQAIVTYLDTKVAKIDEYISIAEKKISALEELKQTIIAEAVTRGIHKEVPKKDSGVKWIGMIPEHWKVMRLSQIAYEHFISNKKIHHQNLLSLSYGQIIRKDINGTNGLLPASFDTYQVVEEGNIILRLTDLQNDHKSLRVGLVKETGIITSAYLCLAPQNMVYSKFLYFQLHACDIKKVFYSMGDGLRQSLNYDGMRKLASVIPPLLEQQEIVNYIEAKVANINQLCQAERSQIEKLKEYKQRLISDVVTGKVKVTND